MPPKRKHGKGTFGFKCCNPQHTTWGQPDSKCEHPKTLDKVPRSVREKLCDITGLPRSHFSLKLKVSRLCVHCHDHLLTLIPENPRHHDDDHLYASAPPWTTGTVTTSTISISLCSASTYSTSTVSMSSVTVSSFDDISGTCSTCSMSCMSSTTSDPCTSSDPDSTGSTKSKTKLQQIHQQMQCKSIASQTDACFHLQNVLDSLQHLTQRELAEVAMNLGRTQQKEVAQDCENISDTWTNLDELNSLSTIDWLKQRNMVLTYFLQGVCGIDLEASIHVKKNYALAKSVEQVYYTRNLQCVLPFSFAENVVAYSVTNSKLNATISGKASPAGSYQTLRNFLVNQAQTELPPPTGDVIVAFDNDQVVGKTYHVRANNKVASSVITSVCVAEVDSANQFDHKLSPSTWYPTECHDAITDEDSSLNHDILQVHYNTVYDILQERINAVVKEQVRGGDKITDHIDTLLAKRQHDATFGKRCPKCSKEYSNRFRYCTECSKVDGKVELIKIVEDQQPLPVQSKPIFQPVTVTENFDKPGTSCTTTAPTRTTVCEKKTEIKCRDPIFVNPNSFQNCIQVLQHIGRDTSISKYVAGGTRHWATVVCDGLPYTLCLKLINHTYTCDVCQSPIYQLHKYEEHVKDVHPNFHEPLSYTKEFGWVDLRIGYGHYEMNMVRSFLNVNWEVFMKDVAYCMGFRSIKAQMYAKSGGDHHKAWELLMVVYVGTIDELLVPYIRDCLLEGKPPSAAGFMDWSKDAKDPRYTYMFEQILTYVQAIVNLRKGIRINNVELVQAGRIKHAPMFHAGNHPKYQTIEIMETTLAESAPPLVRKYRASTQAFSKSGHPEKHQAMDFQLEEKNADSKSWISAGVPTNDIWLRVFRNLDKLSKLRQTTLKRMGCKDPKDGSSKMTSHNPRIEERNEWRLHLREKGYLSQPKKDAILTSVSGEELDPQLNDFSDTGQMRRKFFMKQAFKIEAEPSQPPEPVFVLPKDREEYFDVRNRTIATIAIWIEERLERLADGNLKEIFATDLAQLQRSNKSKKIDFVSLYDQVMEELASQSDLTLERGAEDCFKENEDDLE